MITYHDDIEQGSPEWLEIRTGKYTGSNAYKLLSGFGAGDHAKSVESKFTGNFYTKRGHLLETEALEIYENLFNTTVDHCGYITNSDYPNCLFSPDGFTDTEIVEVKCFGETPHLAIYTDGIPLKILAQIYFGMMIADKKAGKLIIYNPKLTPKLAFKVIDVLYNKKVEDNFKRILGVTNDR